MDHNEFQLIDDLVEPFKQFINQLDAPQRDMAKSKAIEEEQT
jgi:hypothetical protein